MIPAMHEVNEGVEVPFEQLSADVLRALIEEFVTRDGTDYGAQEASMERKVAAVMELLRRKKAKIVFDPQTESCDIREVVHETSGQRR